MANCGFTYNKLRGRIKEKVGTEKELVKRIGRSQNYLTNVFKGKTVFTAWDIVKICEACEIEAEDIHVYFFDRDVTETAQH